MDYVLSIVYDVHLTDPLIGPVGSPIRVRRRSILTKDRDCQCNKIPMQQAHLGGPIGEKITTALGQKDSILDEDCLSINVWGKPQQGEKKKAVLFWIYGGGEQIYQNRSGMRMAHRVQASLLGVPLLQYMMARS